MTVDTDAKGAAADLLFSVARELLANAVKHARARRVEVSVRRVGSAVRLEVSDDGVGMSDDARHRLLEQGHIGLAATAERVEAASGRFEIDSTAGRGTRAVAVLPAVAE